MVRDTPNQSGGHRAEPVPAPMNQPSKIAPGSHFGCAGEILVVDKAVPDGVYLNLARMTRGSCPGRTRRPRAYLGCGQPWAPKTVDAALAEAYAELCAKLEERTG